MRRNRKKLLVIVSVLAIIIFSFQFLNENSVTNEIEIVSSVIDSGINGKNSTDVETYLNTIRMRLFNYTSELNNQSIVNQPYPGAQIYIDYSIIRLGLKPLANVEPLRPDFEMVVNDVTAFKYPIEIAKCRKETIANRTLFIGIISAANYFDKRKLLRETWLRHVNDPHYHRGLLDIVGYGFILGQTSNATVQSQIQEESEKHGDILQVEMVDNYRNLTRKSVALLNWVHSNCPGVDFVLKIDDDCYSNVHNLADILTILSPNKISVYGSLAINITDYTYRLPDVKWMLTYDQWPWEDFPPFLHGSSYLLSGTAIGPLLAAAQVTPFAQPNEDIYVTGILTQIANVTIQYIHDRFHRPYPELFYTSDWRPDPCYVRDHTNWMTVDPDRQIKSSHSAVEEFYRFNSSAKCLKPQPIIKSFGRIRWANT